MDYSEVNRNAHLHSTKHRSNHSSKRTTSQPQRPPQLACPSELSVLSGKSHLTSSSSGSGSTVTERAFTASNRMTPLVAQKGSTETPRRPLSSQRRSSTPKWSKSDVASHLQSRKVPSNVSKESLDVFKFQQFDDKEDNATWGSEASDSDSSSPATDENDDKPQPRSRSAVQIRKSAHRTSPIKRPTNEWHGQEVHSDSGISVRGPTPDSASASGSAYGPPSVDGEQGGDESDHANDEDNDADDDEHEEPAKLGAEAARMRGCDEPLKSMAQHLVPFSHPAKKARQSLPKNYPRPAHTTTPPPSAPTPPPHSAPPYDANVSKNGYDRLASQLSFQNKRLTPVYRRFEALHHRVLLHLQDELAEMEETLERIDQSIEDQERHQHGMGATRPASRRDDRDFGGELQAYRRDFLGRIYAKTQHYKEALQSYRAMVQSDAAARPDDVTAYRNFLDKDGVSLISKRETRFLEHEADLMRPGCKRAVPSAASIVKSSGAALAHGRDEKLALIFGAVLLVLLASSDIQFLVWRLVLLLIAAAAWWQRGRVHSWFEQQPTRK